MDSPGTDRPVHQPLTGLTAPFSEDRRILGGVHS